MEPKNEILDGYVGIQEIADCLNVTPRTIYRMIDSPDGLPFARIGRRMVFRVASVQAWLAASETQKNPRRKPGRRRAKRAA